MKKKTKKNVASYGVWIFGSRLDGGGNWARAMYGGGEAALCFRTAQEAEAAAKRDRDDGIDAAAREFDWAKERA